MNQNGTNDSRALPLKPPHRRLVVMFDGTGNTRQNLTNVSRMFEAIDDSHPQSYKPIDGSDVKDFPPFQSPAYTRIVQCKTCNQSMMDQEKHEGDDNEANFRAGVACGSCHQVAVEPALQPVQLVKYITGVGTTWVGWLSANTLGYGLSDKVKEGYTWLCNHYQTGDEVFVFGFSRGAFSARSLVSLLRKCDGVLKKIPNSRTPDDLPMTFDVKTGDDKKAIKAAYSYYQAYVESTDADGGKDEGDYGAKRDNRKQKKKDFYTYLANWNLSGEHKYTIIQLGVPVKMLGVWDTVGALGVGETGSSLIDNTSISRTQYQFHDQRLSSNVENAYHALALDERREDFAPTLWKSRTSEKQEVKQVWFVGSHCNVGGGADVDDNDDPDDLWQYSYVWMQRHAEKHGLRFFWSYDSPATRLVQGDSHLRTRRVSLRETEPSLENFVGGIYNKVKQVTPFIRETDPKLAMLHWSVLERIKVTYHDLNEAKKIHPVKQMSVEYRPAPLFGTPSVATMIPSGSPEVVALHQVDAEGVVRPANWHIETDDMWTRTEWKLKLTPCDGEE